MHWLCVQAMSHLKHAPDLKQALASAQVGSEQRAAAACLVLWMCLPCVQAGCVCWVVCLRREVGTALRSHTQRAISVGGWVVGVGV